MKKYVVVVCYILGIALMLSGCVRNINFEVSEGILSTEIRYEFHGNFDFNEFRREHNFYLERSINGRESVRTPIEAAEAGQFYLWPALRDLHHGQFNSDRTIIVNFCAETNNWIIQWYFSEAVMLGRFGETTIFSINRQNGRIREYSTNLWSVYRTYEELREDGWHKSFPSNYE